MGCLQILGIILVLCAVAIAGVFSYYLGRYADNYLEKKYGTPRVALRKFFKRIKDNPWDKNQR